ncbi:hypothetical protein ACWCYY_31915 [Kitasatospora sp. NPDC001664]
MPMPDPAHFLAVNVLDASSLLAAFGALGIAVVLFAGSSVPNVDRHLLPIVAAVVVVSLAPLALELLRSRKTAQPAQASKAGAR